MPTSLHCYKHPCCLSCIAAGEVHYIVRFYKDPKSNRAWLQDMQGNKVPLKQLQVVFGNLTIVPVDKVLMSGKCCTVLPCVQTCCFGIIVYAVCTSGHLLGRTVAQGSKRGSTVPASLMRLCATAHWW